MRVFRSIYPVPESHPSLRCRRFAWCGRVAAILLLAMALLGGGGAVAETIRLAGKTASGEPLDVTLDEIDQVGVIEENVYNPYEKSRVRYSGVLLDRFIAKYGDPSVTEVKFTAIDDYRIIFEKAEWKKYRILLVTKLQGERFGLEKKGPARIVFPDFDPEQEDFMLNIPKWLWMIQEIDFK